MAENWHCTKLCEEIDFISIVNRHGYKGGGTELGRIVEAMAIARNCNPCSYFQLQEEFCNIAGSSEFPAMQAHN